MRISRESIEGLTAGRLENQRLARYRADEQVVELSAFAADDRALLLAIYAMLGELEEVAKAEPNAGDVADLRSFSERHDLGQLVHSVRRLGAETAADARVSAAVHDIRGGALTTLFVQLSRLERAASVVEIRRALAIGARDHRKMMRNVVRDLDAEGRARDLAFLPHSLGDLARAMRDLTGTVDGQPVTVDVDCATDAVIAESCVECSAIDRVAYNLLNNAVRYADGPSISAWLLVHEHDLCVAIANSISAEQRVLVGDLLETDLPALYGAFTTSGSGYGLRIVAELVGRAYGVTSTAALTAQGYVGAKIVEGAFLTWFHWPLAGA